MANTQTKAKLKKQQVKFGDLHTSLRLLLVMIAFGIAGIIFLSVSDAAPLTWQDRIKLFNGNNHRVYIPPANSGLPQSSGGTTTTGGQNVSCGSNGDSASITTGSATSSNVGTANTGGNTACGH